MPDQPLGPPVAFTGASVPARDVTLRGAAVTLRPLDPDADAPDLYAVSHPPDGDPAVWTYLFDGPFADVDALRQALRAGVEDPDRVFFAILPGDGAPPRGVCSYLRITPAHGVIEIGNIWFARSLQRTTAATEAIYLLLAHAFDELGYRRVEWKCNALNAPSRRAAERFGFHFEGIFERHMVIKGRNRDTAWFALTDARWPAVRAGFQAWLSPVNFDASGVQRRSLAELRFVI